MRFAKDSKHRFLVFATTILVEGAPDGCLRPDPSARFAEAADLQGASERVSESDLSARRDPAAEPGPRS
jgi:hypothetical protein